MFNFLHKLITESRQAGQAWFSIGKSMLTLPSPPLLFPVPKKHIPRGLAPWFFQRVQWNWAAQAFLDHPFDRWVQYLPPIAVDVLCSLWPSKGERTASKRCQSASAASWDAGHLAGGTAWVWNSHCHCSNPWTLPEKICFPNIPTALASV